MTIECEKVGENLSKNSQVEGGDIIMTNNDITLNVNKIYAIENLGDLEEQIAFYKEQRLAYGGEITDVTTILLRFDACVHEGDIQLKLLKTA